MKLINQTGYSTKWLRELAEFAIPKKLKHITIKFMWRKNQEMCSGHYKHTNQITVTIPKKFCKFPMVRYGSRGRTKKGYLDIFTLDSEEDILHVIAHEFRHGEQNKRRKIHRVYGYRRGDIYSERDADAYSLRIVRKWRREHPFIQPSIPTFYCWYV